jgi:hypothetical protein
MPSAALMSVTDVATQSGFSTKTVLRALAAGELVGSKVRSRWVVWPEDFRAWIDGGRREARAVTNSPSGKAGEVGSVERLRAIERAA